MNSDKEMDIFPCEHQLKNIHSNNIANKIKKSKRKNIKELFENFNGEHHPVDIDWGQPTGKEII